MRYAGRTRSAGVGELRLAALPLLGVRALPLWLAAFAGQSPGLQTSLMVMTSPRIVRTVIAGEVDVGFALGLSGDLGVGRRRLAEIPGVIVLPPGHRLAAMAVLTPGHRLAAMAVLTPKDLEGEAFV